MKSCDLDERHLLLRGDVFKHSLILMGFLVLLNTFLTDYGIMLIEGVTANILIVAMTAFFANIEMTLKGAINFDDKRMTMVAVLVGICGIVILASNISNFAEGDKIIQNNQLSKAGAILIMGITELAIPVIYFTKRAQYKKSLPDED